MKQAWVLSLGVLAGCGMVPLGPDASPPEDSGLVGVRAYPTERSACQVIGESESTSQFLDDSALLIGCPAGDRREIRNRVEEGAQVLTLEGQWLLMSVPGAGRPLAEFEAGADTDAGALE